MSTSEPHNVFAVERLPRTIRRTQHLVFGTLILLAVAALVAGLLRSRAERRADTVGRQGALARHWVEEWRRTSDELTRFARTYTVTGDAAFERHYQAAVAIRDGLQPRPADYDKVYWDLVIYTGRQPPGGTIASLESLMENTGFTTNELAQLEAVRRESAGQALLEQIAMNVMKGRYRDAVGRFTLTGAVNQAYAIRLLHGPEYHRAKARVMDQVRRLQVQVDARVNAAHRHSQQRLLAAARLQTILGIGLAVALVGALLLVQRTILEPLAHIGTGAAAAEHGGLLRRLAPAKNDEFGTVARGLNALADLAEAKSRELTGQQERLHQLVEALPDAVIITDGAGALTALNRHAESLLAVSQAEVVGKPLPVWQPALAAFLNTKSPATSGELTLQTRAGGLEVEVFVQSCELPDGSRMAAFVLRDGTRQKAANRAAELQAGLFAAALDTVAEAVIIANPEGRIVAANRAFETLTGLDRGPLAGKALSDFDLLSDHEHGRLATDLDRVIESGTTVTRDLRLLAKDGFERRMSLTVDRFELSAGAARGAVLVLMDQSVLRRAESDAARHRQWLQRLVDQLESPVQIKDTHGRFLLVNRQFEQVSGQAAATLIGRTAAEAFGPTAVRESENEERRLRQTRQPIESEFEAATPGGTRHFFARKFPVVTDDGELLGTAEIGRDVSRERALEQELAQTRAELDRTRGAAADLQTALATAHSDADAIRERCQAAAAEATRLRAELDAKSQPPAPVDSAGVTPELGQDEDASTPDAPVRDAATFAASVAEADDSSRDIESPAAIASLPSEAGPEQLTDERAPIVDDAFTELAAVLSAAAADVEPDKTAIASNPPDAIADGLHASARSDTPTTAEPGEASAGDLPAATETSADAAPAKRKRSPRKKKAAAEAQVELFGTIDKADEAGAGEVGLDPDGVPVVPGMDLRDAMSRLELPTASLRDLATHFAEELPPTLNELRAALAAQDSDTARRLAHTLAGAASGVSADTLRRLAKTLELALKFEQGDTDRMLAELEQEAGRLIAGARRLQALPAGSHSEEPAPGAVASLRDSEMRRLRTVLEELVAALESGEYETIVAVVARLKKLPLPDALAAAYEGLSDAVDAAEYAEAAELAQAMLNQLD